MEIINLNQVLLEKNSNRILKFFKTFLLVFLLLNINILFAKAEEYQQQRVTGTVTDSKTGDALPGVNVVIQGTVTGIITDAGGSYALNVPGPSSILTFSFLGYVSQSITVGNQSTINVSLVEELTALDEVVVVGYGTQQKVNLTGSVGAVQGAEIAKRPTPNVQNLLQGRISGLQITQSSGTPGADAGTIRIRGLGTFSSTGSNPLVLVDGVEGNLTNLNPNDIESISVLKDAASAAIYGARAANGVILVTTKRGKSGDISVEYHVTLEAHEATRLPELLTNSADYMELWNEANLRSGKQAYFTQAEIDAFRSHPNDPVNYPNFDWVNYVFKTAFVQNHHLSVTGGNEKTSFNLSAGYLDQGGIVPLYDFKRYNFR